MNVLSILSRRGYSVKKSTFSENELREIKKELTVRKLSNPNFPEPKSFPIFEEVNNWIRVPRYYGIEKFGPPEQTKFPECPINLTFHGELRENQVPVFDQIIPGLYQNGQGMINLATSFGKSIIFLKIIEHMHQRTAILIHKQILLEQWKDYIKTFLPSARIGIIQGKKKDFSEVYDIYIIMMQTLLNIEDVPPIFGMVAVDECITGDQFIVTKGFHGESIRQTISDIYRLWKSGKSVTVLSYNESIKTYEWKIVTYAWEKSGVKEFFGFELRLGLEEEEGDTCIPCFKCTGNHKILTTDGWKEAKDLTVGETLIGKLKIVITKIETIQNLNDCVYDLEVADNHNFVCCGTTTEIGIVAHNCHHISCESLSKLLFRVNAKYLVGLSATIDRKDGLRKVLDWHLGPVLCVRKPDRSEQKTTEILCYRTNFIIPRMDHLKNFVGYSTALCQLPQRNDFIMEKLLELINSDTENLRKILILTDTKDHIRLLYSLLQERQSKKTVGYYISELKQDARDYQREQDIIIATHTMFSEGISVNKLNTIVFVSPKREVTQALGRIYRENHTNIHPCVLEFSDPVFRGQEYGRLQIYKQELGDNFKRTVFN